MKISTLHEIRDHTIRLMQSDEPPLATRRGRLARVYCSWTDATTLPKDLKPPLFLALADDVAKQANKVILDEDQVQEDFLRGRRSGVRQAAAYRSVVSCSLAAVNLGG